jgi:hypothetical protein
MRAPGAGGAEKLNVKVLPESTSLSTLQSPPRISATRIDLALDAAVAAEDLRDPLRDRQAETGPAELARHRRVSLLEGREERIELVGSDSDSRVGYDQRGKLGLGVVADLNSDEARAGELDRVPQQVDQRLTNARRVGEDLGGNRCGKVDVESDPLLVGPHAQQRGCLAHHLHEVERDALHVEPPRLDLGDVENVVQDVEEVRAVAVDHLEPLERVLGE